MNIEEIKSLLRSGDVAGAEKAAQELLMAEPDNVRAMILYGTCRQLQGDEATFRDTYRAVKEHLDAHPDALDAETEAAWKRFGELHAKLDQPELRRLGTLNLMAWVLVVMLGIVAAVATGSYFGRDTQGIIGILGRAIWGRDFTQKEVDLMQESLMQERVNCEKEAQRRIYSLYGGPPRAERGL